MKIVIERIIYLLLCVLTISCNSKNDISLGNNDYKALVELFQDFRIIQELPISNGVPDYTPKAIAHQKSSLDKLQRRLGLIDTTGWPIPDRVEYHLVKAEMHGLEFYHKVLKPWSRDPGFYLQTQDGAGPTRVAYFNFDEFPIPQEVITEAKIKLIALPKVLDQAKKNLTDGADDLAYCALHYLPYEIMLYERIYKEIKQYHPDLESIAAKALGAVKQYDTWLKKNKSKMTAPAGVGKDNYNWWMKNVQLIPYTWDELYDIIMREDDRLLTTVAMERNRNRDLPELKPVSSRDEHAQQKIEALRHVMEFTEAESLFTIPEWIGFEEYLGDANALATGWNDNFANSYVGSGETAEWPGVRDFFHKTADREPLPEQTHEFIGHHLDHGFHRRDDRIILGADRQYAIEMIRLEGWAFWLEEMLMHAGYLDDKSARSREIVYWQAAFRTCRAVADLKMHSNEFSLQEAIDYVAECAPNGWNIPNGPHAWYEMQTNLRYVGWHMGMVIGKLAMNQIIAEKIRQQGNDFSYKGFFKEYFAAGIIPMALIRWQLTGNEDEIKLLMGES
jgi:hypothetical protein